MRVRREGLRRTAHMQVSKMSSRGVNSTDTEACNFIMQALTGNQWSCLSPGVVCTLGDYVQEGCTVVCFLKESNQGRENDTVQSGTKYKALQVK